MRNLNVRHCKISIVNYCKNNVFLRYSDKEKMGNVRYGLCCICLSLKGRRARTISYKNFCSLSREDALSKLSEICSCNSEYVFDAIKFCAGKSISHFRISSSIFPLLTHPYLLLKISDLKDSERIFSVLRCAGNFAKRNGISLSFHPSQYAAIASSIKSVRESAARDINLNAEILDLMGTPKNVSCPINIHINRNPESSGFKSDFESGLSLLSKSARRRLVIENEDRGFWNTVNLHRFLKPYKIPLTFDFLHESCNPSGCSVAECASFAAKTWGRYTPIFHYSESASKEKKRSHSYFCKKRPPDLGFEYICEIEAKGKDLAIERLI